MGNEQKQGNNVVFTLCALICALSKDIRPMIKTIVEFKWLVIGSTLVAMGISFASCDGYILTRSNTFVALFLLFIGCYVLIALEEKTHLKKSIPAIFAGSVMWMVIGSLEACAGVNIEGAFEELIMEIGKLIFFLIPAMTYIESLKERRVFDSLRNWLLQKNMSLRTLYWVTGGIAFILSPVADNLTTALVVGSVVQAVGGANKRFLIPAYVNVVVAANAGGVWSPFGDITTLLVWSDGRVGTSQFIYLILPALVNWVLPAFIMQWSIPKTIPEGTVMAIKTKHGAKRIMALGVMTIVMTACFHQFLHLPACMGMMFGLCFLMFLGRSLEDFNIFKKISRVEFDTLFFFFGVLASVSALKHMEYLDYVNTFLYEGFGYTSANIAIGFLSAVVDNIPVMFGVLELGLDMPLSQWLLVTLTAGVGGSLLSVGSAAGVALMGLSRGDYTFGGHLKWAPAILAGYIASIFVWWLLTP